MSTKNGCNVYFLAHPVIWDSEKVEREKNHLILYIKWIVVHFVLFFLLIILCSMKGSNTKEKSILFFTKNWLCYPTFNCHLDQILLKFNALFWQIFSLESLRKCDMKSITRHFFLQYIIKTRSYNFSNCINFKKQENMLLNNLQIDNFLNKTIVGNTEK